MKENNKGSMIILTIIGIATLLVAVIGATFAYFTAVIKGNPTEPNTIVTSKMLGVIEFYTKNKITYENMIPGRPDKDAENKLHFTITNDTDATSNQKYIVYLNVERNEFETDNVVYLLTETKYGKNSVEGGQYFTESNSIYHTFTDPPYGTEEVPVTLQLGKIDAGFTGPIQIGTAELGSFGSVDEWEFEIWVNETGDVQNEDQGKTIECYITIELADPTPETNEPNQAKKNATS